MMFPIIIPMPVVLRRPNDPTQMEISIDGTKYRLVEIVDAAPSEPDLTLIPRDKRREDLRAWLRANGRPV